jgi:hypothetical protein
MHPSTRFNYAAPPRKSQPLRTKLLYFSFKVIPFTEICLIVGPTIIPLTLFRPRKGCLFLRNLVLTYKNKRCQNTADLILITDINSSFLLHILLAYFLNSIYNISLWGSQSAIIYNFCLIEICCFFCSRFYWGPTADKSYNCEKRLLASSGLSVYLSVCLSVRPSAWKNSARTERILMKFHIWKILENLSRKIKVSL